jgi:hypothetical protein
LGEEGSSLSFSRPKPSLRSKETEDGWLQDIHS